MKIILAMRSNPAVSKPAGSAVAAGAASTGGVLAAGLGIAALMSHLGMGAEFGNLIMMVLLAVVAFVAIRFVMSRFARGAAGSAAPALATPNGMPFRDVTPLTPVSSSSGGAAPALAAAVPASGTTSLLPADFDAAAFERIAKMIFIRMQAANDSADLNDLRAFTTPEMFAAVKLDLQDRSGKAQQTDVVRIDAEVLDVATEAQRRIVSVRFHGLIREERDGVAEPFDEIWHLVRPTDGSHEWAIAGIQQAAMA